MASETLPSTVGASAEEGPVDPALRVVADAFDVDPPYVPEAQDLDAAFPERFLDRELSWLRLNQRVLELAEDETLPLLERVRFLAIFASNLDEFYMVRVAGLKRRLEMGLAVRGPDGLTTRTRSRTCAFSPATRTM
jgi:polyphosphate kinase